MSQTDIREGKRRLRIEIFAALARNAARPHSEAEQRAAAAVLGVSHHLPEPQERLPLAPFSAA